MVRLFWILPFLIQLFRTGASECCGPHSWCLSDEETQVLTDSDFCQVLLVESIPENLTYSAYSPKHTSTHSAWNTLIGLARHNISIASFYWSLLAENIFNSSSSQPGKEIYENLLKKAEQLDLRIAQNGSPANTSQELAGLTLSGANVSWINVSSILGQGVLHTKLWLADQAHSYLGSANMDWRSLTQVKELGVLLLNCPKLINDLQKQFEVYWYIGSHGNSLPVQWPSKLETIYNHTHPMLTDINTIPSRVYFASSPPPFNPPGRSSELDAILSVISKARQFVYISVMDYAPAILSYGRSVDQQFWPTIDNELRKAAVERGVEVRLLISFWRYTRPTSLNYLNSLKSMNGVDNARLRVRRFVVPAITPMQKLIPHARVNHNKYMVTETSAFISTSNWSGDYFLYSGGLAFVVESQNSTLNNSNSQPGPTPIHIQLRDIFYRDWNSEYAFEI